MPNRVDLDDGKIRAWLLDPAGRLATMLREKAAEVAATARTLVHKRTGRTAASIETGYHDGPEYQSSEVSAAGATIYLEQANRPHLIFAHGPYQLHNPGPEFWRGRNLGYFGDIVHHPGTLRHAFLSTALWTVPEE